MRLGVAGRRKENSASKQREKFARNAFVHMHAHTYIRMRDGRAQHVFQTFQAYLSCMRDGRAQHVFKFSIFKVSSELSCMRIEGRQSPRFVYVWFVLFVNFVKVVMLF